ncbi:MAG TPA: hypothetical protein VK972_10515 [Wenzhouxiangella sp.]|nr:hypothetical protein [Wenzhouxiangella sp.]
MLPIPTPAAIAILALLLAGAFLPAWQGGHWMATVGAVIAAGTPLAFLLVSRPRPVELDRHPLSISIVSGLGCVLVMIAETRFGPARGQPLLVAVLALATWLLWRRRQRRGPRHRQD